MTTTAHAPRNRTNNHTDNRTNNHSSLRETALVIRREALTRTGNTTIRTATAVLALGLGIGAYFGGTALRDITGSVGSLNFRPETFFPVAMVVILLVALVYGSTALTSGVVEEKQSRVVEILLTKIGVAPLLAGKILGIGMITLAQLLIIGGAGVLGFSLADGWSGLGVSTPGTSLLWLLVWFVLGYAVYALLNTALAATVARQEDLGTALMPLNIVQMALLGVALWPGISGEHNAAWFQTLSFFPLVSSYLMPIRSGMGGVEVWEPLVAAGITLAAIPLLFWVTTRIYRNTALRTGSRVSLRDALTPHTQKTRTRKYISWAIQLGAGLLLAYLILQIM